MASLQCTLAQINPIMGDFQNNASSILEKIDFAQSQGSDWVVFPEMALCGYPPEDLLHQPSFLSANLHYIQKIALETREITAVVGFAEGDGQAIYNAAAIMHNGKIIGIYRKMELPNYGVFDEKRYFRPGTKPFIVNDRGLRVMVTICEDIWIPQGIVEQTMREEQVDVVMNLSASPFHAGKPLERIERLAALAKRTKTAIVYANLIGGQDDLVFDGGSLFFDTKGELKASAPRFEECTLTINASLAPSDYSGSLSNRFIEIPERSNHKKVLACENCVPVMSRVEEIYHALVLATRDYVAKNKFRKVVLGLSGGIDSALTAAIATQALGAENVIGVTMPSEFSSKETKADAQILAELLGIRLITVPIGDILTSYQKLLQPLFENEQPGIENENLQARIRGNILMALSNRFGWLVLTTGNKSETAVGYCTLYGDMAGGFAIIQDVTKQDVYLLADYINKKEPAAIIPQSTIDRPPTAELRHDQKDADSLPPYDVLDGIVRSYVEENHDTHSMIKQAADPALVQQTITLVDQSEHKRRQAAPGVKITPRAFGRDRRVPITNRFNPTEPLH